MPDGRGAYLCAMCGVQGDHEITWGSVTFCSHVCRDTWVDTKQSEDYGYLEPEQELPSADQGR